MTKQCWLVKQEPGDYSWEDLVRDGKTPWTGVRNFQARNNLRTMKPGDPVLFYHSGDQKQIVGIAKVMTPAYLDPTATEGDWSCVDLAPVKPLLKPVTLKTIKQEPTLKDLQLVTHSRLSVMPVAVAHYEHILKLSRD
jgi:predicted RNA-binding protein with PUA-like domain